MNKKSKKNKLHKLWKSPTKWAMFSQKLDKDFGFAITKLVNPTAFRAARL